MRVLVTGASGFLGRVVCSALGSRGHDVMALVRRPGSEPPNTAPLVGDLADGASLSKALADARPDCVVHLAAETATQRNSERIEEVNVRGTERLLDACSNAGAPRFVFASTVVTGDAQGALLSEETELPVQTAYGRSKQAGEQLVRASGLDFVIMRPSHIYGGGGWFAEEIVGRLRKPGRIAIVGRGDNWWDVVRDEDVAVAICEASERAAPGSIYHVVDDQPIRYRDFIALVASALGVGPPHRVPAWLARLAAGRDPVAATVRSARSSNDLIKRELGWAPRFRNARQGVPDAIAKLPPAT